MQHLLLAAILVLSFGHSSAQTKTFKCIAPDGKVMLQQTPCLPVPQVDSGQTVQGKKTPSLAELIVQCSKLPKESTEYHTCAAKLSCREAGAEGSTFEDCVKKLTEARRRSDVAATEKAAERRFKSGPAEPAQSGQVDCVNLYRYARAKGHSYMEAVMISDEAEKQGRCRKSR